MKTLGLVLTLMAMFVIGCGGEKKPASPPTGETGHVHEHTVNGWCIEHGVPEDDCTQCSKKAAEKHQKDGDWCKEHNRAESQCFACNPHKQEEFAAKYKTQFNSELPKPHTH